LRPTQIICYKFCIIRSRSLDQFLLAICSSRGLLSNSSTLRLVPEFDGWMVGRVGGWLVGWWTV
jgi:hypothetical protein